MAYNPRTGRNEYSVDDLIGLAKLGSFGPRSDAVLYALVDLKKTKMQNQLLVAEIEELKGNISKLAVLNSEVEEINIDQIIN